MNVIKIKTYDLYKSQITVGTLCYNNLAINTQNIHEIRVFTFKLIVLNKGVIIIILSNKHFFIFNSYIILQ